MEFVSRQDIIAKEEAKSAVREITLSNDKFSVVLDANVPAIREFRGPGGGSIICEKSLDPVYYLWREKEGGLIWSYADPSVKITYCATLDRTRVVYSARITSGDELAATADLFFALVGSELRVGFENIKEMPGYKLTDICWPRLADVSGPEARMVTGRWAGRLVDPSKCKTGIVEHSAFWIDPIVGGLLYNPSMLLAITPNAPGDTVISSVARVDGASSAGFGVRFSHWMVGGSDASKWFVNQPSSTIRLRIACAGQDGVSRPVDWTDGAKLLRREVVNVRPPSLYQDSVLYKIFMDSKTQYLDFPQDRAITTIAQARQIMDEIDRLTDGRKQIAYLTGTEHEGLDTGYPDMLVMDPRVGTYEELVDLMNDGPKYNTTVSFHAGVNEMYKDSPLWDDSIICRNPNGALTAYGSFEGGVGYWTNYDKFASHGLPELLDGILAAFPIRDTYHLDVCSTRACNVDFNPESPCGTTQGYQGRLKLFSEFNRHGIDVTSEGFMSWFVGHIGHAWLLKCDPNSCYQGDEPVPFVPFVYHGHATYGLPSELNPLLGLLYGSTFSVDLTPHDLPTYTQGKSTFLWNGNSLMDCLYVQNIPYQMLRNRQMKGYSREGDIRRVTYDNDTYVQIKVSDEAMTPWMGYKDGLDYNYEIVVDGRLVSKDFTTFVPSPRKGAWIAYSKHGGTIVYPAPAGWTDARKVLVTRLLDSEPDSSIRSIILGDEIKISLPAACPVRLEYR